MLKRLLIAVLVLSVIMAFTGTAFSDVRPANDVVGEPVNLFNPNSNKIGLEESVFSIQPASRPTNLQKVQEGFTLSAPPLATFCEDLQYSGGSAYFWTLVDFGDANYYNTRFTTEENFSCTLYTAWVVVYGYAMVGAPDMMVYLWEDDGFGFPGAALDSILVLNASLPPVTTAGWMGFDFKASPNAPAEGWIFEDGEDYHMGIRIVDNSGVGTDVLGILTDDGTTDDGCRTSYFDTFDADPLFHGWGTMCAVWGGDYAALMSFESCCGEIPFTDCYDQSYHANLAYTWRIPDLTWANTDYAMRFDVGGPETLVSIDVYLHQSGSDTLPNSLFGDDDIFVNVYGDDGTGLPDDGNVLWSTTLTAGTYAPGWWNIPVMTVIDETFHIGFSTSGIPGSGYERILSDDASVPQGRATTKDGGVWMLMSDSWGGDYSFVMYANMCKDQFSDCKDQSWYTGIASFWEVGGLFRQAQGVRMTAPGEYCQVNEVGFDFYDPGLDTLVDLNYTHDTKISVYTDAAGLPGTELASIIIPGGYGNYAIFPATHYVDFNALDVYVSGDYWVVCESQFIYDTLLASSEGVFLLTDGGSALNEERGGIVYGAQHPNAGIWRTFADRYGTDFGVLASSATCCVPFDDMPRVCLPGTDPGWATIQGNQGRNGASMLSVGDAWCNMNLNWSFDGPAGVSFTGPVIYGDQAVCSFTESYLVFDITTGAVLYTLGQTYGDGFLVGLSMSSTPTIANVGGTDIMFICGGSKLSIGAVDWNTGAVIWQNTALNQIHNSIGRTNFTTTTILNDGVTDVLYYTTVNGYVFALEALTGALYTGWATNPVALTGNPFASGATDGTDLFYSTQQNGTQGDIYSIDAFTGAINWTLSGTGGLVASGATGYNGFPEGFRGGVAYDSGDLFAVSYANDGGVNDHPIDGWFYSIDAASGAHIIPPTKTNRAFYSTPVVDGYQVYCPTLSQWATPTDPTGGNLIAFHKATGIQAWGAKTPDDANYYTSGVLSCEPDVPGIETSDLLFVFNANGFLECYSGVTGEQVFNRRVDHGGGSGDIGLSGALAMTATDGLHMMFADFYGGVYDFNFGVDRPRLELQTHSIVAAVEFGSNPALPVNFGPAIVNTGCEDLVLSSATVDELPISGASFPAFVDAGYVPQDFMDQANSIADNMQRAAFMSKFTQLETGVLSSADAALSVKSFDREKSNSSLSAGIPAWFISLDAPIAGTTILPGDTAELWITVNQPLISRGPQSVYIAYGSNDPDHFLNAAADAAGFLPELKLTLVGGCLVDTTTLTFGVGGANIQLVTNTSRLGEGDWTPHGFEIDGEGSAYYQGGLIMGVSKYAIAWNNSDWVSGNTEIDSWNSLQPDPNWCDNTCKAALTSSYAVGSITSDGGATYDPIAADMVCKTYVDSVENFDTDPDPLVTTWDWSAYPAPFDDTLSMGLMVNARVIGVTDLPALANLTLEILDINERNGDSVTNWYMGQMTDYDVGGDDARIDQSISTAWSFNPGGDDAWGSIKIPFGCGELQAGQDFTYDPLINAKQLDGDMAFFDVNAYFDSAYIYLSSPAGLMPAQPQAADGEMHTTYVGHDFGPLGTYSYGIANFGIVGGLTDNTSGAELADMAHLVNKWAGFGRGDVNDDGSVNLADIIHLAETVNGGNGAVPFAHLSDVNADNAIDAADIAYLVNYYFNCGPCPMGDWMF